MENKMFCFQCEQTAGCSGCTGNAGVCGKTAETAKITKTVQHLQRRILSEIYIRKIPEEDVSDRKEKQK